MNTNTTKQKLNNGETVYGAFFRTPDTSLVELQGYLGWDFLVLDGEHGTLQPSVLVDHIVDELKKRRSKCSSSAQAISRSKSPTKPVFNCAMTTAEIKADYDATK